jgi:peptidoglycan/xylan/chitin deacetylase (PgdA/CDA1 family)
MILTYHHIGSGKGEYWVSVKSFARQMGEIINSKIVHLEDYDENDLEHIAITFDDGGADIKNALPILRKYGYPFSVFIVGDWFGRIGYLGKDDAAEIIAAGGRLQWHTKTHRKLTKLSAAEIKTELSVPDEIRALDQHGFNALAYPYWVWDSRVIQILQTAAFSLARSGNGFAMGGKYALDSIKIKENTVVKDKIVKYIELIVPTWACNFRCHYCYIGQHCTDAQRGRAEKFRYSPEQIADALSMERVGGIAIVNFCAHGETLILPRNLEYIRAVLGAGHFVMIVSNMTQSAAINELLRLPAEWKERLFFKCSFHWLELKRLNLLETFTENTNRSWEAGASITVEMTPSDELEPEIPEIKDYSLKYFGALPHITVPRDEINGYEMLTKHTPAEYEKIWGQFDSALFDFKMKIWGKKVRDFCYAGDWGYSINMATGDIFRCSSRGLIGNLFNAAPMYENRGLPRFPTGRHCPFPHCFNGHFWKTFGMAPTDKTPTYADMRDRVRADGTHWLCPRVMAAFNSNAADNNKQYGAVKRWLLNRTPRIRKHRHSLWWHIRHLKF